MLTRRDAETYNGQGGFEAIVVLLGVFGIVPRSLSFVGGVEIEPGSSSWLGGGPYVGVLECRLESARWSLEFILQP